MSKAHTININKLNLKEQLKNKKEINKNYNSNTLYKFIKYWKVALSWNVFKLKYSNYFL